jgi:hypothetical protein
MILYFRKRYYLRELLLMVIQSIGISVFPNFYQSVISGYPLYIIENDQQSDPCMAMY